MPRQTPEEFARHLLRGLTVTSDQRFYDDAAKDIAARDAEIAEVATAIPLRALIAALEGTAANTDTDPRWLAATELRRLSNWETGTLRVRP